MDIGYKLEPVTGSINKKVGDLATYYWSVLEESVIGCDPSISLKIKN